MHGHKKNHYKSPYGSIRQILGHANWAAWFLLIGGRSKSKSYSVCDLFVSQFKNKGIPFTWFRLTQAQVDLLLKNDAQDFIDKDIVRRYDLHLKTIGNCVYDCELDEHGKVLKKTLMARILAVGNSHNNKGSLYDKDFMRDKNMRLNVCLDEFERITNTERNTFDILRAWMIAIENIAREEKSRIKIFLCANKTEDAPDILAGYNFIPNEFGIYKLVKNRKKLIQKLKELDECKSADQMRKVEQKYSGIEFGKRAVIWYMENDKDYDDRRKDTLAAMLDPNDVNFTNKVNKDTSMLSKKKPIKACYQIVFKDASYTVYDDNIVCMYNKELVRAIPMERYLGLRYDRDQVLRIHDAYDRKFFKFKDMTTQLLFEKSLRLSTK